MLNLFLIHVDSNSKL